MFRLNPPQIALDYIFHCNEQQNYEQAVRENMLKVKMKNAIMQVWSEVKKQYKVPSINEAVNELLKEKNSGKAADRAQRMRDQQKLERKQERMQAELDRKEQEAKESYLKVEQYDFVNEKMINIKRRLKGQQAQIDQMERKMLQTIKRRMEKEMGAASATSQLP